MSNPKLAIDRRNLLVGALSSGAFLLMGCSAEQQAPTKARAKTAATPSPGRPTLVMHKDPNCGCCTNWARIAQRAGYTVSIVEEADMSVLKQRLKVPAQLASCHTTVANGLVIEGHVPIAHVQRLLTARPQGIRGIAVPGMPAGSPGMEMPDGSKDNFDVVGFYADGKTRVFTA